MIWSEFEIDQLETLLEAHFKENADLSNDEEFLEIAIEKLDVNKSKDAETTTLLAVRARFSSIITSNKYPACSKASDASLILTSYTEPKSAFVAITCCSTTGIEGNDLAKPDFKV